MKINYNHMKKLLFALAILLASMPSRAQQEEINSEIEIQTRQLTPFENLRVMRGINVTLVEGKTPKAEIHIQNASADEVVIVQNNKDLDIRMRGLIYKDVAVNVYLYYQNINEIAVGSGASIFSDDVLETDYLKLESSTDASIELEIDANVLEASVSASRIELIGKAKYISVSANTGGRFLAANLKSEECSIKNNTGSSAQIWVTEKLNARAGSGASIEYTGAPSKVEIHTSLGGKVESFE